MNRLQKKCFAASAGLHVLLGAVLVFGPGFLPERKARQLGQAANPQDLSVNQVFTLLPETVFSAPSQPPQPSAQIAADANAQPQPERPAPKAAKGRALLPSEANPVPRTPKASSNRTASRDAQAKQFDKIIDEIRQGTSSATRIEMAINVAGGGDDAYAQYVRDAYTTAWDLSGASAASESAVVKVSVTIANDGKVLSSK